MGPLPLRSLDHVSLVVRDVQASIEFYRDLLGFTEIRRPDFGFNGSWLWRGGTGIHLLAGQPVPRPPVIDPRADHISFVADNLGAVILQLQQLRIKFVEQTVLENGIAVRQIFFHDPDLFTIEVCECDLLPICPLRPAAGGAEQTSSAASDEETSSGSMQSLVQLEGGAAPGQQQLAFQQHQGGIHASSGGGPHS